MSRTKPQEESGYSSRKATVDCKGKKRLSRLGNAEKAFTRQWGFREKLKPTKIGKEKDSGVLSDQIASVDGTEVK